MNQLSLYEYYSLTTLTIINSFNNLTRNYGYQCTYEHYPLDCVNFFENELGQIDSYHFPLWKIKKLSLVNNKIEAIKPDVFRYNPVREFEALDNFLEVVESRSLPATEFTEIITLKNNKIVHIEPNSFGVNLKILKMDQNELRYLQEDALDNLKSLEELSFPKTSLIKFLILQS